MNSGSLFKPRRLVYLGTPGMAVRPLAALVEAGFEVVLVVTRPDRRRGRGRATSPSPVKAEATRLGLEVTDDLDRILDVQADLGVVVAYGRIIPTRILNALRMVNIHFSLLPRWRGAAPTERAILAGDAETGVCLMDVVPELDAGGVYRSVRIEIEPNEYLEDLRNRLVAAGTDLLIDALTGGLGEPVSQTGEVLYAEKITADDLRVDWTMPAEIVARTIRLGDAWTNFRGKRLKILRGGPIDGEGMYDLFAESRPVEDTAAAKGPMTEPGTIGGDRQHVLVATGQGLVELTEVKPEGKGPMDARAWRNGVRPIGGERFDT